METTPEKGGRPWSSLRQQLVARGTDPSAVVLMPAESGHSHAYWLMVDAVGAVEFEWEFDSTGTPGDIEDWHRLGRDEDGIIRSRNVLRLSNLLRSHALG